MSSSNMNKILIGALVVVLAGIAYAGVTFPKFVQPAGSAVGATFNSAKIAAVNISPATASATSSAILNTDASGRWIKATDVACTGAGTSQTFLAGAGLASLVLQAATTTSSSLGLQGNTNFAANMNVSTSSIGGFSYQSTTTPGVFGPMSLYWPSNTYLAFAFNATNTAACVVSVSYLPS